MRKPEVLAEFQTLAAMVRDLREGELYIKNQKKLIRRFLRMRMRAHQLRVPWRTAGSVKDKRPFDVDLPDQSSVHKPHIQGLQQHERFGPGDELAVNGNGNRHKYQRRFANKRTAAFLRSNGK